jgi:hypothetical protein
VALPPSTKEPIIEVNLVWENLLLHTIDSGNFLGWSLQYLGSYRYAFVGTKKNKFTPLLLIICIKLINSYKNRHNFKGKYLVKSKKNSLQFGLHGVPIVVFPNNSTTKLLLPHESGLS